MKKLLLFVAVLSASILLHSCEEVEDFDELLLIGKWKQGDLYYKYLANHTGSTWDESDDVREDEAQPFTWQLVRSELQQIHIMDIGGNVPKYYTVTELTTTTLKYKDNFRSYSFSKVP